VRILALVHRVPYPPNKGDKIRAYHEIKYLAEKGHTIDLLTFADVREDTAWRDALAKFCRDVQIVRLDRRFSRARSVLALPRGRPLSVGYFESFRFRRVLDRWLAERKYEIAFCYSSPMAEYVRGPSYAERMARIMDFVDVDSDKWSQYAEHTRQPMKALYRFEAKNLATYERAIAEEFDASTFVSPAEAETFRTTVAPMARRVRDIPNGVDAEYFGAKARAPRPLASPLLVFVGQMDYFANVDGVTYFADEIMPRIRERLPGAEFRIVGRAPTADVEKLGRRPGITVTGDVQDVRDHLKEANVSVAPLRIARGIQNKVLESMAARVPSVVSPQAMEGIEGVHGKHALVCPDPESYARAVISLVEEPSAGAALASAARELVTSKYAWEPAMKRLEDLMLECAPGATKR
jgi:sugar transferase (PEP-CTERM/EpsH1 system associated)